MPFSDKNAWILKRKLACSYLIYTVFGGCQIGEWNAVK